MESNSEEPHMPAKPTSRRPRRIATAGTLYHPHNAQGDCMTAWCTRVSVGAAREVFNLGNDKRRAEQLDREVRARLIAEASASEVRAFLRKELWGNGDPDPVPPPIVVPSAPVANAAGQHFATFRDLIRVCAIRALEAKPEVSRRYLLCLLNLVEGTLLYRSGKEPRDRSGRRVEYEDYDAILDLPLTILDNLLVADFKHWRLERARRQGDDELSAKISANTEIRQASSALGKEALLACRSAGLHLPSFENFFNAPKFKKCKRLRPLPHERVVKHLHEELATITDEGLFLAIAVALHRGLRHAEILAMQYSWLQRTTGPSLVVRTAVDFSSKNYGERTVPLPEWLYERLKARGPGYLIAADASERERTLDRAVAWVRQHGLEDSLQLAINDLRVMKSYLTAPYFILAAGCPGMPLHRIFLQKAFCDGANLVFVDSAYEAHHAAGLIAEGSVFFKPIEDEFERFLAHFGMAIQRNHHWRFVPDFIEFQRGSSSVVVREVLGFEPGVNFRYDELAERKRNHYPEILLGTPLQFQETPGWEIPVPDSAPPRTAWSQLADAFEAPTQSFLNLLSKPPT
jgi:hypothetical protein